MELNDKAKAWLKQTLGVSDLEGVVITDPSSGKKYAYRQGVWSEAGSGEVVDSLGQKHIKAVSGAQSLEGVNILDPSTGKLMQQQNGTWVEAELAPGVVPPEAGPTSSSTVPESEPDSAARLQNWITGSVTPGVEYIVIEHNTETDTRIEIARATSARLLPSDKVELRGVTVAVPESIERPDPIPHTIKPISQVFKTHPNNDGS